MAEVPSKTLETKGQEDLIELHPEGQVPMSARMVELSAPMPLLPGLCQSSDHHLPIARKSWMRELPAGLRWRQDRVSFVAWSPRQEAAALKEKEHWLERKQASCQGCWKWAFNCSSARSVASGRNTCDFPRSHKIFTCLSRPCNEARACYAHMQILPARG
jgi:hypothetical protein